MAGAPFQAASQQDYPLACRLHFAATWRDHEDSRIDWGAIAHDAPSSGTTAASFTVHGRAISKWVGVHPNAWFDEAAAVVLRRKEEAEGGATAIGELERGAGGSSTDEDEDLDKEPT